MQRGNLGWDELDDSFTHTFNFFDDHPSIDSALQVIKAKIFEYIPMSMSNFNWSSTIVQHWMECYNVMGVLDDNDPQDTNIPKYEGTCAVEGLGISSNQFLNPLKTKKVNIGSLDNPKFANIRDDETDRRITDLLHKLQDLIPTNFLDMKRIV